MVVDPERYVDAYAQAGADIMTIHVGATRHIHGAPPENQSCWYESRCCD